MSELTQGDPDFEPIGDNRRARWIAIGVVAGVIAIIGAIPAALGFGPFGARLFADDVTVHILNLSGRDVTVTASFATPVESPNGSLHTAKSLAGPITIVAVDGSGQTVDDLAIDASTDLLYNVGGGTCFAVFDATAFYSGAAQATLRLAARIPSEQRLYPIEAPNVVLPRRPPPSTAAGAVHWIEDVNCTSLDPANEQDLLTWAEYRMLSRFERQQERDERLRELQQ
jgi:hypothetical protein